MNQDAYLAAAEILFRPHSEPRMTNGQNKKLGAKDGQEKLFK
jgi:hypothetical protein